MNPLEILLNEDKKYASATKNKEYGDLVKLARAYYASLLIDLRGECTCNPINGTACPSCVESNKVRYPVIPIEGEL